MTNRTKAFKLFLASLLSLTFIGKAYAICPICTIAVAGGVVLAEKYGIDNTITGIWVGGLTISLIVWTINWLQSKKIKFKAMDAVVSLAYFLMIPVPLFLKDLIGNPYKKIWGIDKLLLGMIIGSIVFYLGATAYDYLKVKNNNKAYFPFQKVVMPIAPLIIFSLIFYFITK